MEHVNNSRHDQDLAALCGQLAEDSPLPTAAVQGDPLVIRYANPPFCRLFGKTRQDLIGRLVAKGVPEANALLTCLERVSRTGQPETCMDRAQPGEPSRYLTCTSWPARGLDGRPSGMVIQITEPSTAELRLLRSTAISERLMLTSIRQHELAEASGKAQESLVQRSSELENMVQERTAKLRETVGELEVFSYHMLHNMRAPLRALNGFAHILHENYGDRMDEEGRKLLQRIISSSGRMDQLILDVLDYTRVLRDEAPLSAVDLNVLMQDLLATNLRWTSPGVTVEVSGTLPVVSGHKALLAQCFSTLVDNAVKFVAPGVTPLVRIWAQVRGDRVRINFRDNGIGLTPEQRSRIFEMLQPLRPNSMYEGTGIGLSITRRAIERMGGTIGLRSTPGRGSTFWIELAQWEGEASHGETQERGPHGRDRS